MNIIFCLSYLSVNQTIFLIEQHGLENVQIITSNKRIESFFQLLYKEKKIIFFLETASILLPKNLLQLFVFPLKLIIVFLKKNKAWSYFKSVSDCNIYFFFNSSGFFQAWLIQKLCTNNNIFYEENLNLDTFLPSNTRMTKLNTWFINKLYSEEVIPLNQNTGITYKISEKYLNKCNVNFINIKYDFRTIVEIVISKLNLPSGDILYLPPLLNESKINRDLYINFIDDFVLLCKKENIKLHLKRHPRSSKKYSDENQLFDIPIYIPASFLVNYKLTIGLISASLFERANYGGLSISLVYLLYNNDHKILNSSIDYLKSNLKNGNQIFFPKNINELFNIIKIYIK